LKILVQWTLANPRTWDEYDVEQIALLPKKPLREGDIAAPHELIDDQEGWVHALIVQGVSFQGYDHYGVEQLPEGVVITGWADNAVRGPDKFYACQYVIKPPAYDSKINGLNTCQWVTYYGADGWLAENAERLEYCKTTRGPVVVKHWSEFFPPPFENTFHGIWVDDDLHEQHRSLQTPRDWREWIE
jgi:hypothetical protein